MERKLYPCNNCGRKVPIRSKGLCGLCRNKELPKKQVKPISKQKNKPHNPDLEKFFEYHINQIKLKPICENCGTRLKGSRAEVAHIVPKREMGGSPEVAAHLSNALHLCVGILGGNGCHEKFDLLQLNEEVKKMPAWAIALERFSLFKGEIKRINKITSFLEMSSL